MTLWSKKYIGSMEVWKYGSMVLFFKTYFDPHFYCLCNKHIHPLVQKPVVKCLFKELNCIEAYKR